MGMRGWTMGYEGFHCAPHVAWHCWERGYRPTWREVVGPEGEGEREGKARVRRICRGEETAEWMGAVRGVSEYWEKLGVDWETEVISDKAKRGGVDAELLQQPQPVLSKVVLDRVLALAGTR